MNDMSNHDPEDIFNSYETPGAASDHSDGPAADVNETPITAPDDWGNEGQGHIEPRYEGTHDAAGFPRTDVYDRVHSLGLPEGSLLVIGSSAIETVVGPDIRRGQDLDFVADEGVYGYLRNQRGMEEVVSPDGFRHLVQDDIDVSLSWGGKSVEQLREGSYTHNGVAMAGLPDVYEYKEHRGEPKDLADLQIIRDRLYGDKPLPLGMLKGETEFVESCLPEHLHGRPELQVAANGLYIVRTVFGDESNTVRSYNGPVEQGAVPATFHAWEHTAFGLRDGQRNIDVVNDRRVQQGQEPLYDDDDRVAHAAGYGNHDVILGHGRRALNPTAHDEQQAADLSVRHLEAVGVTKTVVLEKTHATTKATTFNEDTKAQDIDPARGHVLNQELGAGSDASSFRRADGSVRAVKLVPEDLSRVGAGYDKPLQRLRDELNSQLPEGVPPTQIRSAEDGLVLADEHPDYPVIKNGVQMTLREAVADHFESSERFMRNFTFPSSWGLGERATQMQHADFMGDLAVKVRSGEITGQEALRRAEELELTLRQRQA